MTTPAVLVFGERSDKEPCLRDVDFTVAANFDEFREHYRSGSSTAAVFCGRVSDLDRDGFFDGEGANEKRSPLVLLADYGEKSQVIDLLNAGRVVHPLFRPASPEQFLEILQTISGAHAQDSDAARRDARIPISLWAEDLNNILLPPIYSYNISQSGISLSSGLLAAPDFLIGKGLKLKFALPERTEPLCVEGKIVWLRKNPGFFSENYLVGVAFEQFEGNGRQVLDDFLFSSRYTILALSEDPAFVSSVKAKFPDHVSLVSAGSPEHAINVLKTTPMAFVFGDFSLESVPLMDFFEQCGRLSPETVRVLAGNVQNPALMLDIINRNLVESIVDLDQGDFDERLNGLMEQYELNLYQKFILKKQAQRAHESKAKETAATAKPLFGGQFLFSQKQEAVEAESQDVCAVLAVMLTYELTDRRLLSQILTLVNTFLFEVGQIIYESDGDYHEMALYGKIATFRGESSQSVQRAVGVAEKIRAYYDECFADLVDISTKLGIAIDFGDVVTDNSFINELHVSKLSGDPVHTAVFLASMVNHRAIIVSNDAYHCVRSKIKANPIVMKGRLNLPNLYVVKDAGSEATS